MDETPERQADMGGWCADLNATSSEAINGILHKRENNFGESPL